MVLKLEKIGQITIVDSKGKPSSFFHTLWQRTVDAIQAAVNSNAEITAQLAQQLALLQATQTSANAAQQTANEAQATADAAGGGTARSGSTSAAGLSLFGTGWVTGPTINLTGVSAGTLTITGTAPTLGTLTNGTLVSGQYRVVELAGGTTIFTGSMSINETGVTDNSVADVAAFTLAETTTGAVSYRMDVRRSGGPSGSTADCSVYFYVRRS